MELVLQTVGLTAPSNLNLETAQKSNPPLQIFTVKVIAHTQALCKRICEFGSLASRLTASLKQLVASIQLTKRQLGNEH
jgi:hypothetical protein